MANGNVNGGGNSAMMAVLVVAVIAIAAFIAYNQGYLGGAKDNSQDIEINVPSGGGTNGGGTGY